MKIMESVFLVDEPICVADINSYITSWVQEQLGSLGPSLLPEYAVDRRSTMKWTWQALTGPDRPRASAWVDNVVGLIRDYWRIMRMRFSRTRRLKQHVEHYLDGHDGRRLHVPQAIKRNCRMAHEAQSADSQSGDDDD